MKLNKQETNLIGKWKIVNNQMVEDETTVRINQLIEHQLLKITDDESGWNTLYQDPLDGRYWELIYPQSELQSGGPPCLKVLSISEANQKYHINKY